MAVTAPPAATESVPVASSRPWAEREWVMLLLRLARRRTALFGLVVVAGAVLTAVFAPAISPFDPLEQGHGFLVPCPSPSPGSTSQLGLAPASLACFFRSSIALSACWQYSSA